MGVELLGAAEASLLEHYLDTVEHLPDDVQRTISLLREIDHQYQHVLSKCKLLFVEGFAAITRDLFSILAVQQRLSTGRD